MLWAHYSEEEVGTDGYTEGYSWGSGNLCFCHCPNCGCTTHWHSTKKDGAKMGVNARLVDGFQESGGASSSRYSFGNGPVEVRQLEGATG